MLICTRYGDVHVSQHAVERWKQRTGRNYPQMVEAVATAHRPTKNQLRRIMKREPGWQPPRILVCDCAYFLMRGNNIVTVYDKTVRG